MLSCQRDAFFLPDDVHYLNCAYMAPLSRAVEAAGIAGIRRKRVPSEIGAEDFFAESDAVRERFARLVNAADARDVAIVPSVSYGLATAARNAPVERGARIVVVEEQFPSNVYTWRRLAGERGAEIHSVAPPGDAAGERGRRWNERLLEAITPETAVVALPHVHWADGTRFDLEAIGERAREVGALLVVDGTQSVGALPFDVGRVRPDALVCAGYKWLLGPYSIGLAWYGPRLREGVPLEENWIARRGSEHFAGLVDYEDAYGPGAVRFDVGERSNFILLPMLLAALDQVLGWGVETIQAYAGRLAADVADEAVRLGYRVEDPTWRGGHLFGIRLPPGRPADALQQALRARGVSVSVRGSAVRVSPHVYNDDDDVSALVDALGEGARH